MALPRVLLLLVIVLAGSGGSASAQSRPMVKLAVAGGLYLEGEDTEADSESVVPLLTASLQVPVFDLIYGFAGVEAGLIATYGTDVGPWPCPAAFRTDGACRPDGRVRDGAALSVMPALFISAPITSWLIVEPFAGVGANWIGDGRAGPNALGLRSTRHLIVGYGGSLYLGLATRWALLARVQGLSFFPGDQEVLDAGGRVTPFDPGRVHTASLLVGLTVGF